jgi:hypothetical protein
MAEVVRAVGDESKSHVVHLEAPNRRLFVQLPIVGLVMHAPSLQLLRQHLHT